MSVTSILGGLVAAVTATVAGKLVYDAIEEDSQPKPQQPAPIPRFDLLGIVPKNTVKMVHLQTEMLPGAIPRLMPPGTDRSMLTGKTTTCRTSWIGWRVISGTFPRSKTVTRAAPERECVKGSPAKWWVNCVDGCWTDAQGPMIYRGEQAGNAYGGWNWADSVSIAGGGTGVGTVLQGGGFDELATVLWSLWVGIVTGVITGGLGSGLSIIMAASTTTSGAMAAVGKTISDAQKGKIDPQKAVALVTDYANTFKNNAQKVDDFLSLGFGE